MGTSMVRIETVEFDASGSRQISARGRTTQLLAERRAEIEAAIREAADLVGASLDDRPERSGWQVSSVEASFGITVAAETGVVLTKASAEASLTVKIVVERR
jgi:hypothetical protein